MTSRDSVPCFGFQPYTSPLNIFLEVTCRAQHRDKQSYNELVYRVEIQSSNPNFAGVQDAIFQNVKLHLVQTLHRSFSTLSSTRDILIKRQQSRAHLVHHGLPP